MTLCIMYFAAFLHTFYFVLFSTSSVLPVQRRIPIQNAESKRQEVFTTERFLAYENNNGVVVELDYVVYFFLKCPITQYTPPKH